VYEVEVVTHDKMRADLQNIVGSPPRSATKLAP